MNWKDINAEQKKTAQFDFDYGPLLDELLAQLKPDPLVVELGTYLGCSAAYLAEKMQTGGRIFSVDLFDSYAQQKNFFPKAMANLKACGFRDKVHILSCRSWEAAQFFDDKEVDLVWVDASHDYAGVRADIDAWAPKVAAGGFLAGHDLSESGVALAVERYCFEHQLTWNVFNPEGWKSWWIKL